MVDYKECPTNWGRLDAFRTFDWNQLLSSAMIFSKKISSRDTHVREDLRDPPSVECGARRRAMSYKPSPARIKDNRRPLDGVLHSKGPVLSHTGSGFGPFPFPAAGWRSNPRRFPIGAPDNSRRSSPGRTPAKGHSNYVFLSSGSLFFFLNRRMTPVSQAQFMGYTFGSKMTR